ncbi:MAG: hypothetical protein A3C43_08960 [Candidatus Schekmanbacteria bacterium RIFCSPHIGHO2_02_FULL_38_11]|uniref:RNA polymerase sigma factor n=1 Tax=Candidatus Schekmanbacteria bacterium RIFCSPLOWO2_12_FULL_38_15 TaxID=1817883 RepID=A0A1F7SN06_9BACT|nr:MAG: hypothetical protein A2043_09040 [Candidatus Schekmanbacteria bacterium GWA2_38_9]OGL48063.1 MAG: hypothetical protein A3H37_07915 [Candidatus Schekmanbacteria bacterium RIFCSPLOWO2_02_FULL_38_14]OGL49054.1 MAG: hypothetical protein A3C43_08960 [Candidatus Schekmanbacteria bacterium RIFCSPHIGHO2_02_FULL_38_11]OGL54594.1 MAG: hypothetical protein A3G31_10475 [Candidatus Schekmanbacteria bacterium RIFCSPLOWO2_12_FULL_38_15]
MMNIQKEIKELILYDKDKEPINKSKLILKFLPFTRSIAARISMKLPANVEVNDLVSAGIIGLMDAVEKFDPSKEIKFKTYAEFRIRGAILDELRALDWLPRSLRQWTTQVEDTYYYLEQKHSRPATDYEMACELGIGIDEYYETLKQIKGATLFSLDNSMDSSDNKGKNLFSLIADSEEKSPLFSTKLKELKKIVGDTINRLPEKEKLVISLYYYEDLTMKEIGKVLDITESRVSQIHTKAVILLKNRLKKLLREE